LLSNAQPLESHLPKKDGASKIVARFLLAQHTKTGNIYQITIQYNTYTKLYEMAEKDTKWPKNIQNGRKIYKMAKKIQNGQKIYTMAKKYTNWP
jgi:hypothetical protein